MAISYVAAGTASGGADPTALTPTFPAGLASGDLLVLTVANKYPANPPSTPSGWTLRGTSSGGAGASGADSGEVYVAVYTKVSDGTESGSQAVTVTGANSSHSRIHAYRNGGGPWYVDVASGTDTSSGTGWSAASSTNLSVDVNDWVIAASGVNGSGTSSSHSLTLSGVTFGSANERTDIDTATGDNIGLHVIDAAATAGAGSGALTYAATLSATRAGATVFLVLSETASAYPTIMVEMALTTAPMSSSPSWTDVTSYVDQHNYPITIERGRSDAQSMAAPGTCTLVLNNDDKRFTPGYTGGTYGSDVKVGKLLRITESHAGNTYRRFFGYITSFDLGWPGGVTQQNRVMVTAVDILGIMSQFRLRDLYPHVMVASDCVAYWPLDDHGNSGIGQELTGYRQKPLRRVVRGGGGTCRFDDGKGIPVVPEKLSRTVRIKSDRDSNGWTALGADVDLQSATTSVGIGGWVRWDAEDDDTGSVFFASISLTADSLLLGVNSRGAFFAQTQDNSAAVGSSLPTGRRIADGRWHHVYAVFSESAGGSITGYVDGQSVGASVYLGAVPTVASTATVTIGAGREQDGDKQQDNPTNVRVAHWGVWTDSTATALGVDELYEAGLDNWDGKDRTSARVTSVLTWMGVPSNRQDVQRGMSMVAIGNIKGLTAYDYITQLVASEQGFFFQHGNGTCTFQSRSRRWGDVTSEATLSWHDPALTFTTDVDQYVTGVEVSHSRGSVRVSDRTAATTYGPRELTVDAALADPEQAKGIAEYVLELRSSMKPRMSDFTYDLLTEDTQATRDAVLGLELGDLFTVSSLPTQAHTTSADFWVEGIRETISTHTREITFITTPYKDFTGFWKIGSTALNAPAVLAY